MYNISLLAYVTNITCIPESLILFQNESIYFNPILGVKIEETVQAGANLQSDNTNFKREYSAISIVEPK